MNLARKKGAIDVDSTEQDIHTKTPNTNEIQYDDTPRLEVQGVQVREIGRVRMFLMLEQMGYSHASDCLPMIGNGGSINRAHKEMHIANRT